MSPLESKLKSEGLRLTEARRQIFSVLTGASKALSAKDIFQTLIENSAKADLVSVYRNLELFQRLGIVHEVVAGKFAVCEHRHSDVHEHIHVVSVCEVCGDSSELNQHDHNTCELLNDLKTSVAILTAVKSITLKGHCQTCAPANTSQ